MSKERDLLAKVCVFLDRNVENNCGLVSEIRSLLSQPNEEKLTMQQRLEEYKKGYARAEQRLKREPLSDEMIEVAWMNDSGGCFLSDGNKYSENWTPLYATLPKREPLSKEEYMSLFIDTYHSENPITDFVRLIEKAHGIGGEL